MARLRYLGTDPKTHNYVYRRDLTAAQRKVLGRRTWLRSLGTKVEEIAVIRWHQVHEECEAALKAASERQTPIPQARISDLNGSGPLVTEDPKKLPASWKLPRDSHLYDQIVAQSRKKLDLDLNTVTQLVKAWSERELHRRGQAIFNDPTHFDNEAAFIEECQAIGACGHHSIYHLFNPVLHQAVNDVFALGGIDAPPPWHSVWYTMERIVKPEIVTILEAEAKWRNYDFSIIPPQPSIDVSKLQTGRPGPPSEAPAPGSAQALPPADGATVGEVTEKWLSIHDKPIKTQTKLRRCVAALTGHLGGDVPVESITPVQLIDFYGVAVRLPARPSRAELKMSFAELVAQDIPVARRVTIQTVANWMNILHSACNWGRKMRLINHNPIIDNKPDIRKATKKHPTLVPTEDELATIFGSEIYTERAKSPAWFWLPLLAIYTGARLNELGQLERADVVWDDIPYLHMTTDTTASDDATERRAKTLKTRNSKRRVPIHPKLLLLGFREYWASSNDFHLFPDLPHQNLRANQTPTQDFSRNWGRFLRNKLRIRKGVKFHSFRHLFTDVAEDAGVNPKARSVLVGHANENDISVLLGSRMTDNYGSGYGRKSRLQFMRDEISKVDYPSLPAIKSWS